MPRKRRSYERGGCYHITHRCHGRQYLFRFAKYRDFCAIERLLRCLWMADEASFRDWHRQAIERQLDCDRLEREEYWSTAVAVGDRDWLAGHVKQRQLKRHRIIEADNAHYLQGMVRERHKTVTSRSSPQENGCK